MHLIKHNSYILNISIQVVKYLDLHVGLILLLPKDIIPVTKHVRVLISVMNFIVLSAFVDGCTDLGVMLIKKRARGDRCLIK